MSYAPKDVMIWLGGQCLGLTPGVDLFCGEWGTTSENEGGIYTPKEVDQQILILPSPVAPDELNQLNETVGVQILARGSRQESAEKVSDRIEAVHKLILAQQSTVEMNCICYTSWEKQGDTLQLGKDENGRHLFSVNLTSNRNP
jgi:hypothetical protein